MRTKQGRSEVPAHFLKVLGNLRSRCKTLTRVHGSKNIALDTSAGLKEALERVSERDKPSLECQEEGPWRCSWHSQLTFIFEQVSHLG